MKTSELRVNIILLIKILHVGEYLLVHFVSPVDIHLNHIRKTSGPVAQWIRRLTTDQEIPGSSPGRIGHRF